MIIHIHTLDIYPHIIHNSKLSNNSKFIKLGTQRERGDRRGGGGAALLETDMFRMITNGLGRLANRREAGYIVKITKSFHSLVLINAGRQRRDIFGILYWGIGVFA